MATLNREPIIKSIEAENKVDLMLFHEHNICSVYKAKPAVPSVPYHLERSHQYVVIDRQHRDPFFRAEEVAYEVIQVLLVKQVIALDMTYGFGDYNR
ncbi:MAG: hypothetical protein ABSH37_18905 [Bryobacteraceae bacterium]